MAMTTDNNSIRPEDYNSEQHPRPRQTSIAFIRQFARVYSGCVGYDISYYILN